MEEVKNVEIEETQKEVIKEEVKESFSDMFTTREKRAATLTP